MAEDELEFEPSKTDLQHLREWISKSQHIIQDYDDKILSAFVRGCKGSLQKTKRVLEEFNSIGQRYPEIMKNYDPLDQTLAEHLTESAMFPLPRKTPDGSIVIFNKFNACNPYNAHNGEFFRYLLLTLYIYLWKNDFGSGKWIFIFECKNTTLTHMREFTPVLAAQGLKMVQNALPIRLQAIHLLNVPPFMEYAINLVKSLASKKISERVYVHSTVEKVDNKVLKDLLPKDYGGDEETSITLHERWYETVKSFRTQLLEEESKMRRLDPLRPKKEDTGEMSGTFKSLNVD